MPRPDLQVPPQESSEFHYNSYLLKRELELRELYDLAPADLDVFMAELATVMKDETSTRARRLLASYFLELATLIRSDRQ
jgi:hypothetical protein